MATTRAKTAPSANSEFEAYKDQRDWAEFERVQRERSAADQQDAAVQAFQDALAAFQSAYPAYSAGLDNAGTELHTAFDAAVAEIGTKIAAEHAKLDELRRVAMTAHAEAYPECGAPDDLRWFSGPPMADIVARVLRNMLDSIMTEVSASFRHSR